MPTTELLGHKEGKVSMNEQFVFRVSDDSQFAPLERLPRKRNQSTDFAFRYWLAEHGDPGEAYQVLEVVSDRVSVDVREVKDLQTVKVSHFLNGADEDQRDPKAPSPLVTARSLGAGKA